MTTILHVFRKDLRHRWLLAAFSVLFSLLETLAWYWDILPSAAGAVTFFLSQIVPIVIQFILTVAILQSDPTVGDRAFWRTRPISPWSLLGAKLLFLFAVFGIPSLAVNAYIAVSMDAPVPVVLGMVIESTGMIAVEALAAAAIGSMTASLLQAAAAMLSAVIVGLVFAALNPALPLFAPWRMDLPDHAPRIAALMLYSGAGFLILLAHQFSTRRTGRTLLLFLVEIPCVLFSAATWPVSIHSASLRPAAPAASLKASPEVQVRLVQPATLWTGRNIRDRSGGKPTRELTVAVNAELRSIPAGRIVQLRSISTQVRFENGEVLEPPAGSSRVYWPYWSNFNQAAALCRGLGLAAPALSPDKGYLPQLRLFSVSSDKARPFFGRRGTLTATLSLYEIAFHEVKRLSLRPGGKWIQNGEVWRVRNVSLIDGKAVVELRHLRVTSTLITEGNARPDSRSDGYRYGYVLLNTRLGEFALSSARWAGRDTPLWSLEMNVKGISFGENWKTGGGAPKAGIDDAWLSDAVLVILAAEPAGEFTKQITLEGFEFPAEEAPEEAPPAPFWQ